MGETLIAQWPVSNMVWYLSGGTTTSRGRVQDPSEGLYEQVACWMRTRPLREESRKDMTLAAEVARFGPTPVQRPADLRDQIQSEHGPPLGGPNLTKDPAPPFLPTPSSPQEEKRT